MNMKGTVDDDDMAFSGCYAARGMGVVALSVAGDSLGGAGHSGDGALSQGIGAPYGGGRSTAADAGGAGRYVRLLPQHGRSTGVDDFGSCGHVPERYSVEIGITLGHGFAARGSCPLSHRREALAGRRRHF